MFCSICGGNLDSVAVFFYEDKSYCHGCCPWNVKSCKIEIIQEWKDSGICKWMNMFLFSLCAMIILKQDSCDVSRNF